MDAVISIIYARPLLINCRVNNDPHTACVHSSRVRFPLRSLSFSLAPRLRRVLKSRYTLLSLARALRARGKARRGEISRADISISWHADALSTSARGNSARCVSLSELVSFFVFFFFLLSRNTLSPRDRSLSLNISLKTSVSSVILHAHIC